MIYKGLDLGSPIGEVLDLIEEKVRLPVVVRSFIQ